MSLHHKLAVIVALSALAMLASFTSVWPSHDVALSGRPVTLSGQALLAFIVIGLACTGTDALVRSHPKAGTAQSPGVSWHWILPTAVTVAAWGLLAESLRVEQRIAIVLGASAALLLLTAGEYYIADSAAPACRAVRLALQLATYGAAALVYASVRLRIPLRTTGALCVATASAAMGLRIFSEDERVLWRTGLSALGLGALLGVISGLLYARITAPPTSALLLAVYFYVAVGLTRQLLRGRVSREVALEYLLVGLAALVLLLFHTR